MKSCQVMIPEPRTKNRTMRVKAWGQEPESPCGNKSIKSETSQLREGWRESHCGQKLLIFLDKSIMMWNRSHAAHRVRGSFSCNFSWRDRFELKPFLSFFTENDLTQFGGYVSSWIIWFWEGMVKQIKLSRETRAVNNLNWKADLIRQVGQFSAWYVVHEGPLAGHTPQETMQASQ